LFQQSHILDLIILLGGIQGIIFSIYLWIKPFSNRKASLFLSLFILSFSLNGIYNASEGLGIKEPLSLLSFSPLYCTLLIIASFHFFIHFLIKAKDKFEFKKWLIFVPFVLQFLFQLSCFSLRIVKKESIFNNVELIFTIYNVFDIVTLIFGVLLLLTAIWKVRSYDQKLMQNYAEISAFSLSWINTLLFCLFGIWILFALPTVYELTSKQPSNNYYYPMWISTSVLIYWIGYSAYSKRNRETADLFIPDNNKQQVGLSSKTDVYYQDLLDIMSNEKPFLNPDLNLHLLAEKFDISSGYLSQIINRKEGKNFFDFINSYRVNAFKEMVLKDEYSHLSILGVAFEAGFKSKSTFNLSFKKLTGTTPSAYKKSVTLSKS